MTFSSSNFEGNPGLCGEFVLKCDKVQNMLLTPVFEKEGEFIINKNRSVRTKMSNLNINVGFIIYAANNHI